MTYAPDPAIPGALTRIAEDLDSLRRKWALVGCFAMRLHTGDGATEAIEIAVSTRNDPDAEALVATFHHRGYAAVTDIENQGTGRLAAVRLQLMGDDAAPVQLLFAISGVEPEIAESAVRRRLLPGVIAPVASLGGMMALKLLAGDPAHPQDVSDFQALARLANADDLRVCEDCLTLIGDRGFNRGRDLLAEFERQTMTSARQ